MTDTVSNPNRGRPLLLQKIFLFTIALLVYANSLNNKFNLDDELYHNHASELATHGAKGILQSFTTLTFIEDEGAYEYRPLTLASFVVQYQLLGSAPQLSHAVNIIVYALSCVLLFALLWVWFGHRNKWIPLFITILFTLHPLHTEIVDSIKNRDELLAFFFALLSYLMAWKIYIAPSRKYLYFLSTILFFFLAVISKKTIWPFFFVIPLAYYFFSTLPLKKIVRYTLVLVSSVMLYRLSNLMHLHANRPFFEHENPFYVSSSGLLSRAATATYIMGRYLWLHIFPYHLAYYYGSNYVPIVTWQDPLALASLIFHFLMVLFIFRHFKKRSLLVFGMLLYLAGMVVYSNLFFPAPGLMAERYTYISSLGFCIVICVLLNSLFHKLAIRFSWSGSGMRQLQLCLLLVSISYATRCIARNMNWYDKETLFSHDMPYLGSSAKANSMYAEILVNKARYYKKMSGEQYMTDPALSTTYRDSTEYLLTLAKSHFKKALEISPAFPNALNNIGIIYIEEDSLSLAKSYMQKSLPTTTGKARTFHDIAMIYMKENKPDSARLFFNRSIAADSFYLDAYCDLSKLLITIRDTQDAERVLLAATRQAPTSSIPYIQLADVALFKGDTAAIVRYCETAAELKPFNAPILSFLVNYYYSNNNPAKAAYYQHMLENIPR